MGHDTDETRLSLFGVVVLVGVLVLLSVLFKPAMSRARPRARTSLCRSNLKQLYICLHTYMQDSLDALPGADCDSGRSGSNWYQVLVGQDYLGDKKALVCASDPTPETFNTGPVTDSEGRPHRGIDPKAYYYDPLQKRYRTGDGQDHVDELFPDGGSYGMNREVGGRKLQEVTHKSRTPLLMDSVHPSFEDGTRATPGPCGITIMPSDAPFAGPHNARFHGGQNARYVKEDVDPDARYPARLEGGNNVLYLDGHVEFVSGGQLGNRAPKCDADPTKWPDGSPFLDPPPEGAGEWD